MSHYCYDFLADSLLFSEYFLTTTNHRLEDVLPILEDYHRHCMHHEDIVFDDIRRGSMDGIRSLQHPFGDLSDELTRSRLMAHSILQDALIVRDPLFSFINRLQNRQIDATFSRALGLSQTDHLEALQSICRYMKDVTPFVSNGFLNFFPDYAAIQRPGIPIFHSPTGFSEVFEQNALRWIRERATVSPMVKERDRITVALKERLSPCRYIHIEFEGSNGECSMAYSLHENDTTKTSDDTDAFNFAMKFSDTPPDDDIFEQWVFESINRSALYYLDIARKDTFYANLIDAIYSPQNDFILGLVAQTFSLNEKVTVDERPIDPITFGVQVPETMDTDTFLRIRNDRQSLFSFRCFLNEKLDLLSSLRDSDDIRKASTDIQKELYRKHLPALRMAVSGVVKRETLRWIAVGAGMGVGFATQPGLVSGLIALGLAAGNLGLTMGNVSKLKSMPGYFWNRVMS